MRPGRPALFLAVAALGGCAHDRRDAAVALAQAGGRTTAALEQAVGARVERLRAERAAQDFVAAYPIMRRCAALTHGTGDDPSCDSAAFAAARAANPVNGEIGRLAAVVARRGRALAALGAAYAALGNEAAYDAPGALDGAIAPALAAVNDLGAAVGLSPLPALVSQGARLAARALAADAQRRRLLRGSRQIAAVTHHLRLALDKERALFAALEQLMAGLDEETRHALLNAGLVDPAPMLRLIGRGAGMPVDDATLAAALGRDGALRAAGEAATLDSLAPPATGDLDAGIALLAELEAQHARFEHGPPPDPRRLAADANDLAALAGPAR